MAHRLRHPGGTAAQGLTLIEVAVALALVVILAATALPPLGQHWARWRTQHAAERLTADAAEARFEAVRLGRNLQVNGRAGAQWCWVVSEEPGCACDPMAKAGAAPPACAIHQVSRADHPGVQLLQAPALSFSGRDGSAVGTPVPARLGTAVGDVLQVEVGAQGRPRLCAREGRWPRVADCG